MLSDEEGDIDKSTNINVYQEWKAQEDEGPNKERLTATDLQKV